jgi:hypothetical protein
MLGQVAAFCEMLEYVQFSCFYSLNNSQYIVYIVNIVLVTYSTDIAVGIFDAGVNFYFYIDVIYTFDHGVHFTYNYWILLHICP